MGNCPSSHPDKIDGLCYKQCPSGWEHVPAMPYHCRLIGAPSPYGRGVGVPMQCAEGKDQDGALCYDPPQKGWRRIGATYWQDCPAGAKDIGVACERENYNRGAGTIPNLISSALQSLLG